LKPRITGESGKGEEVEKSTMALVDDLIEWRNVVIAACGSLEIHRLGIEDSIV
jgi:hypothetical protein